MSIVLRFIVLTKYGIRGLIHKSQGRSWVIGGRTGRFQWWGQKNIRKATHETLKMAFRLFGHPVPLKDHLYL